MFYIQRLDRVFIGMQRIQDKIVYTSCDYICNAHKFDIGEAFAFLTRKGVNVDDFELIET